jgi:hypothetical protein
MRQLLANPRIVDTVPDLNGIHGIHADPHFTQHSDDYILYPAGAETFVGVRSAAHAFASWRFDHHRVGVDRRAQAPRLTFQIKRNETPTALMSAMRMVNPPLLRIP